MKKRLILLAVILLGVVAFWNAPEAWGGRGRSTASGRNADHPSQSATTDEGATHQLPGKASVRFTSDPAATHSPERLGQFYLPLISIDGLPLEAALKKLQAAYEEACRETGETPIQLTFSVPPGLDRPLTVKIGSGTLENSIRLLAALSSLKVKHEGPAYLFEAPDETGKLVKKTLPVPPDILSRLRSAASSPSGDPADLAGAIAALGVELVPSTRLKFFPGSGTLQIETTSAADEVAISAMVERLVGELPIQHKLQTRIIELPAGMEWTPPERSQLDEAGIQLLMREVATTQGAGLRTLPSVVTRDGQTAEMKIVRDLISPVPGSEGEFKTDKVGVVLDVTPVILGLGQRLDVGFNLTEGDIDPKTGAAVVIERASIEDTSFTRDAFTRLHVETRPDGSRILLLITPTLIDATGRPVRMVE